jgi:hypothetical protein
MRVSHEVHRHRCEVRECLRKGQSWTLDKIKGSDDRPGVLKRRGRAAAEKLWADYRAQAALGNTGEPGDWRKGSDGS